MDVLISFDQNSFEQAKINLISKGENFINDTIDAYHNLGLPRLSHLDFPRLMTKPKELIFEKVTGGELSVGGVKLKADKAFDLLEFPIGVEPFLEGIQNGFRELENFSILGGYNYSVSKSNIDEVFTVTENFVVGLTAKVEASLESRYKRYAKSEKAKAMFEFSNRVIELFQELNISKVVAGNGESFGSFLNEYISKDFNQNPKIRVDRIVSLN